MSRWRVYLLVVLALLLPMRGALAAAMLCPPPAAAAHAEHHHHDGSHDQGCNMCAAFCSATPLPSAVPAVAAPAESSRAAFPELHAPAPTFVSDGQERPPRSI